jgi:tetratricopeptide (TPR) repeat protein
MRKKQYSLLIGLLILALLIYWLGPMALRLLPTRYAMRLPEPLQVLALPPDPTPILPTAAAPISAEALVFDPTRNTESIGAPATPTPLAVAVQYASPAPDAGLNSPDPTPTLSTTATATPWPLPPAARMAGFVHKYQEWNNCGPATLAMALTFFGVNRSQQETGNVLRPNPEDRNVTPDEMAAYVNDQTELMAISRVNGNRGLLQRFLANNIPVIIEVGIDPPGEYRWLGWYGHYLLPVAYDEALEQFWVYDSWLGTSEIPQTNADPNGRIMTYAELDTYWPQFNRNYIVLFRPEQLALVQELLGEQLDDNLMWQGSLAQAQLDASREPNNAFYWFNLGTTLNALGNYDKAAVAFDQARAIGLPWRMLWYQFGPYEAYYHVGRPEEILLLTDTTLKDRPYFEESFYYRGLAEAANGNTQAAQENFEKALRLNPNFAPAATALEQYRPSGG